MAEGLITGALPKSRAGRKAAELDAELVKALVTVLGKTPTAKDESGEDRPNFVGPPTEFDSQGKASSAGRRYADAVSAQMNDQKIKVNVYTNGKNGRALAHLWRIYIPLSASQTEE